MAAGARLSGPSSRAICRAPQLERQARGGHAGSAVTVGTIVARPFEQGSPIIERSSAR
jgi:hypothetical protein